MSRKYREYSYDEWKKAMDLHNRFKLGDRRISRILGISEDTIKGWIYYGKMSPAAKWTPEPCNELGYVIGVLYNGDGCVCKVEYEYRVRLAVIDKEFVETFSRAMSRLLGVNHYEPYWSEKQKRWYVEYRSKAFYTWYKKYEKRGLQGFKPFIEYNKETVKCYLRGLYDSEGSNSGNKQIYLSNNDLNLLHFVQHLLKKYFDIKATGPYLQKKAGSTMIINGVKCTINYDFYYISIGRKPHVSKFLREIGFDIVRKQLGLKKHEKVFVEERYVEPYKLVEPGLFKLPFSDDQ